MKLKPFVFPVLYISLIFTLVVGLYFTSRVMSKDNEEALEDVNYVSSVILNDVVPVVSVDTVISDPFVSESVKITRYFYNIEDDIDKQKESVIYYDNTYMPNTGLDYTSEESFKIVSILDGTIIDIKEDELLGKIVEIRHNNELVSSYAGLSEISVQKGETVTQGMKIGMSGTNKLNESLGNHLHFELYHNGSVVNPEEYYEKLVGEL